MEVSCSTYKGEPGLPDEARGLKPLRVWKREPQPYEEEKRTNVMTPEMCDLAETLPIPELLQVRDERIKEERQKALDGEDKAQEDPWATVTSTSTLNPPATGAVEADAATKTMSTAANKKSEAWAAWNPKNEAAGTQDVRGLSEEKKLALKQKAQDKYRQYSNAQIYNDRVCRTDSWASQWIQGRMKAYGGLNAPSFFRVIPQVEEGPVELYCKPHVFRDMTDEYARHVVSNKELCHIYVVQAQNYNKKLQCWPVEIIGVQLVDDSEGQVANPNHNTVRDPFSGKIALVDMDEMSGYLNFTTPARLQGNRIRFTFDQLGEELRDLFNANRAEDVEGLRVSGNLSETQTGPRDMLRTVFDIQATTR